MKRAIEKTLLEWKQDPKRKILLLRGARQVGKTYSFRELGKTFSSFVEVNFEENPEIKSFFEKLLYPLEIIEKLAIYFGTTIIPGESLPFFDEIQACLIGRVWKRRDTLSLPVLTAREKRDFFFIFVNSV